jgi:hypothetical protein
MMRARGGASAPAGSAGSGSSYGGGAERYEEALNGTGSNEARLLYEAALTDLGGPAAAVRLQRLASARVVGTTCASTAAAVLASATFHITILDEASQLVESTSLLSVARFGSRRLLVAGDPKQLPPVLGGPPVGTPVGGGGGGSSSSSSSGSGSGSSSSSSTSSSATTTTTTTTTTTAARQPLLRRTMLNSTLFERLARTGFPVAPLLTQYRCHPTLSALPSRLFYSSQLRDGIHSGHAPPRFRLAPRLMFFDTSMPLPPGSPLEGTLGRLLKGKVGPATRREARVERGGGGGGGSSGGGEGGSYVNAVEAECVAALVGEMLAPPHSLPPSDIAVICLYRAQVGRVRELLLQLPAAAAVLVGTVDACQGSERSVVILSACATGQASAHTESPQRLCVALSRAKSHLCIVGEARALWGGAHFQAVITAAAAAASGLRSSDLRPLLQPGPRLSVGGGAGGGQ